ncbi:MAG: DUF5723 family protein [Bacteroidales bacterium]
MKRVNTYRTLAGCIVLTFFIHSTGIAQYSNTMYFMKNVPQANLLNPAFQPACNFYFAIPGLGPFQANAANSSLSISNILFYDKELDSTITFLHPRADKNAFLKALDPLNSISADVSTGILSFGWRSKDNYFSFQLSEKAFVRLNYPKDLFHLPIYFALDPQGNPYDFDLSGFGLNAAAYTEMAFGLSRKISEDLTIGGKAKLLFGQANLSTTRSDITVNTDFDQPWQFNSQLRADASLPFTQIPRDSTGKFDFENISVKEKPSVSDILDVALFHPNVGMALDLGVTYQPLDAVRLSASILDLGFIRWKNSTYNVVQDARFEFSGIEMSDYINGKDTSGFGDALLDTLKNSFTFEYLEESYVTSLPTHIFLGGNVNLTKGISVGALAHIEVFKQKIYNNLILSANMNAGKALAFTLSYSLLHNKQNDLGLGLAFKPGPFHMYLVFDNIPTTFSRDIDSGIPIPAYMKGFNARIGMNLVFGCNKQKKINKDLPLVD